MPRLQVLTHLGEEAITLQVIDDMISIRNGRTKLPIACRL
jgi:hypothetical protein